MSDVAPLLRSMRAAADLELGPGEPLALSDYQAAELALDRDILLLAKNGLTYVEIARRLDMTLPQVVRRIAAMLNGSAIDQARLYDYLFHQMQLLEVGIESALEDMRDNRVGDADTERVASNNRHFGRQDMAKFLSHQAAIVGLLRQRVESSNRTRIEIAVVRSEDFEAI